MEKISGDCGLEGEKCEGAADSHLVDRISQFPDDILVLIISGLPLKDAGRTSILSSRWIDLWKYTSRLSFHDESALDRIVEDHELLFEERVNYMQWVNRVMETCKSPTLSEFSICFDLDFTWRQFTTKCIGFALAHQVERLELDLVGHGQSVCREFGRSFIFPEEFLFPSGEGLSTVEAPFNFDSLKVLSLKCVDVSDLVVEFFIRQCPSLEQLVVWGSCKVMHLEVSGPSLKLKHLEIRDCSLDDLKVFNTNIRSICITRSPYVTVMLQNLPSLTELSITSLPSYFFAFAYPMISLCRSQLEVLTLCGCRLKDITKFRDTLVLTKLKKLVLQLWAPKTSNLLGVFTLLKAAPLLGEFVVELGFFPCEAVKQAEEAAGSPHKFLKILKISGYRGRTSELELVKYFLENAVVLEKIIVDPSRVDRKRKPIFDHEIAKEQSRRRFVSQQLEGEVPEHIELIVL